MRSLRVRHPSITALTLALLILALATCSEREDPLRDFGLVPNIVDSLYTLVIPSSNLDTYYQTTRQRSSRIWVGIEPESDGDVAEAKILLRFPLNLPAGALVLADTLFLNCEFGGDYGDPVPQAIDVHRITSDAWFTDESQGWPFNKHVPLDPAVTTTVGACVDSPGTLVEVLLPASLAGGWAASPDSNFGLALVAAGGGGFKRFLASGGLAPLVGVRYAVGTDPGADTTRVRLALAEQATLFNPAPKQSGGTGGELFALVGGPFDFRAIVGFDLSAIPAEATLNGLRLILRLDPGQTLAGEDSTVTIGVHEVVGSPSENLPAIPPIAFVASPVARTTVNVATDSTLSVPVAVLGRKVERGILLKIDRDFPDLDRLGLFTREGPAAQRPQLEVIYALPARIRL